MSGKPERDGHVHVLSEQVANQIAAGEVVERPASVVKELVENSIDAGSRHIAIAIARGGRALVSVRDDGEGMTRDDAVKALERQATSKIADVGDIEHIATLGFRGEAIPSIASVSRFTLVTRRPDADEGTAVRVEAGRLVDVSAAGTPVGTLVEVRDLFLNVPARQKFLRAPATEEAHVKGIFTVHALAHPEIGFSLTVDGNERYRLAPAASLAERMREIFGGEFLERLVPLPPTTVQGVTVSGFLERPDQALPARHEQYVFVNGRPASAPTIAYALKEAYPRGPGDTRPAVILLITLSPTQVDVNVHPTKREVRFRNHAAVKSAIGAAVEAALGRRLEPVAAPRPDAWTHAPVESPAMVVAAAAPAATGGSAPPELELTPKPATEASTSFRLTAAPVEQELPLTAEGERAKPWNWFRFLALTASGYLLLETDTGVVTVNPHAARERIAYEELLGRRHPVVSQRLLIPESVRLSPADFARLQAALATIRAMGFELEEFGTDTFKVEAVPQIVGELSPAAILSTLAGDLASGVGRGGENWRSELIAKSVAKSFAVSPLKLDAELAVKLIEALAATKMPYLCPRGKPIMIFTSTRELDRKFARN